MERPAFQFRIWHLVFATFLIAIVCGVSRQAGVHPLLVLVGMLYASGPWTALLAGAVVRLLSPRLERRAVGWALSGLVAIGVLLSMTNSLVDPGHLVTLTCGLWCPQILLYFLLRPLLLEDYGEDSKASDLTR
jgi:hypothetical protein